MQTHTSRYRFNELLRNSLDELDFRRETALILAEDPYFFAGHLEHLWFAESDGDVVLYDQLLNECMAHIQKLAHNKTIQERLRTIWTIDDAEALQQVHELIRKRFRTPLQRLRQTFEQLFITSLCGLLVTKIAPREGTFLRLEKKVDVAAITHDILTASPICWSVYTTRRAIHHHKHTHSIALRGRTHFDSTHQPVDGLHESVPTEFAYRFEALHNLVLAFAHERKLSLGRVAIVRLEPYQQAYRHFDSEEYLVGRNRYHLVLSCGEENILSAGTDTVNAQKGEIWFFDNHVMHRAKNNSPVPRIHVIFDGYPLGT